MEEVEEDAGLEEVEEEELELEPSGLLGSMMVMPVLLFCHCATAVMLSDTATLVPAGRTP